MLPVTEISVNDNLKILVDDDFAKTLKDMLFKRYHSLGYYGKSKKYAVLHIQIPLHHLVFGIDNIEEGKVIDHINGNNLDNRKSNLRMCTQGQNNKNRKPVRENQYKGVYKIPSGRYQAKISNKSDNIRKQICIGTYDTPEEAAVAYNNEAIRLHGEYACINEIR